MNLTEQRIIAGLWQGRLSAESDRVPQIVADCGDRRLAGPVVAAGDQPGEWLLTLTLPADILADGLQTVVMSDAETGTQIASVPIMAGQAVADDLRAEIALLRAELDLLKRAFRRHCVETD